MPNEYRIMLRTMSATQKNFDFPSPAGCMNRPIARPATMSGVTMLPHFFFPCFIVSA